MLRYLLYFLLGGSIVSLVTYLGARGSGWAAAFIAMFPAVTVITFVTIYLEAGAESVGGYIRGLFLVLPAWICYLAMVYFLAGRIGLISIPLGVLVYLLLSFLLASLV